MVGISYFSIAVNKHYGKRQIKEDGLLWPTVPEGDNAQEGMAANSQRRKQRVNSSWGKATKSESPSLSDIVPPSRLHSLKVLELPKTVSPNGNQVTKYKSHRGTFVLQTITIMGGGVQMNNGVVYIGNFCTYFYILASWSSQFFSGNLLVSLGRGQFIF